MKEPATDWWRRIYTKNMKERKRERESEGFANLLNERDDIVIFDRAPSRRNLRRSR